MDNKNTIETIGYILKEEKFSTLSHNIIPNTFVLETLNPYPGYHGKDLPGESAAPEFVFFVTKKKYSTEQIVRASLNIQKYLDQEIDVARADITIFNKTYPCIRIKNYKDFSKISELQACFQSEGFEFAKSQNVEITTLVNIQKHFYLEETEEDIYHDLEDPNSFYLQIPVYINWEKFRAITMKIKNSLEGHNFDAALGLFYRRMGVVDVVRIYDKSPSLEKLKDIRKRYLNEIKKLLLNNIVE